MPASGPLLHNNSNNNIANSMNQSSLTTMSTPTAMNAGGGSGGSNAMNNEVMAGLTITLSLFMMTTSTIATNTTTNTMATMTVAMKLPAAFFLLTPLQGDQSCTAMPTTMSISGPPPPPSIATTVQHANYPHPDSHHNHQNINRIVIMMKFNCFAWNKYY